MRIDNEFSYDAALRRLIDLRFADDGTTASEAEIKRLESAIRAMVKRQENPSPKD